jgi:hypothetical protein
MAADAFKKCIFFSFNLQIVIEQKFNEIISRQTLQKSTIACDQFSIQHGRHFVFKDGLVRNAY